LSMSAHPNPVAVGQTVYIDADIEECMLNGAVIEVYNLAGNRIDTVKVQGRLTPINIRYATGSYLFVLRSPTGFTRELKIIVQ